MEQNHAAGLLHWLDKQGSKSVIDAVMSQIHVAMDSGVLHTAAATPVCLQVDVTSLSSSNAMLALEVMGNTGRMEAQTAALINQQIASIHTNPPGQDDDAADEPPTVRVCLQMQQVPLPLCCVPEVMQQVINDQSSSSTTTSSNTSTSLCTSLLAVVTGVTPPAEVCHSQRFHCPSCGQLTDVPTGHSSLPCCSIPKTDWLHEDVTGRLMVQTQQLWVSELSRATGRSSYGVCGPALQVQLPEALAGSCNLGQVVHIIGHAVTGPSSSNAAPGGASSCCIQVKANSLQVVQPHVIWPLPPTAASTHLSSLLQQHQQQPLHTMWELLTAALAYNTPIDPHLAVAMLLSAASVGGSSSSSGITAGPKQSEQVNLLVLHEAFSPATPRLLREAAALLSPQSVSMPVQQAQHVTPIASGSSSTDQTNRALFASILQLANSGIAAADLAIMTPKSRTQLLQALQQHSTPLPKDMPPGLPPPPLTTTVWAAAAWQEVCPAAGGHYLPGGGTGRPGGRRGAAAGDSHRTYQGFDLCLGDGTVHEDDVWGLLDVQAMSASEQSGLQHSAAEAGGALQGLIRAAAGCTKPVLSDAAQALLGQYFLVVRQSVDGSSYVSKPHLLASLVAVASAAARLQGHSTVLEHPDATLAVVLMEQTLANKLGDAYHSLLDLPCGLNPSNDRTLDEQLQLLHGVISRALQQYGLTSYDGCQGDGGDSGCFGGAAGGGGDGEGSDVSGCHGGVCGAVDDDLVDPEE